MSSSDVELIKAQFYYEAIQKLEDRSQLSYDRANSKVNILISIISTIIPIVAGIGYVVLSTIISLGFFIFYITTLVLLVTSLVKCVNLLGPKWFTCIDMEHFMRKYDNKDLSYLIFKVSSKWEKIAKENLRRIAELSIKMQQIVELLIFSLISFVIAFAQLELDWHFLPALAQTFTLSENGLRAASLADSIVIFIGIIFIWKISKSNKKTTPDISPKQIETSENMCLNPKANF
jgi:hypothetical protein